jgi:hypothetical protein
VYVSGLRILEQWIFKMLSNAVEQWTLHDVTKKVTLPELLPAALEEEFS